MSRQETTLDRRDKNETAGDVSAAGPLVRICRNNSYLMLLRLVAKDSLATKAALHQLEPNPLGLIAVTLVVPVAV